MEAGKDKRTRCRAWWETGTSNTGRITEGLQSQEALGSDGAIQQFSKAGLSQQNEKKVFQKAQSSQCKRLPHPVKLRLSFILVQIVFIYKIMEIVDSNWLLKKISLFGKIKN